MDISIHAPLTGSDAEQGTVFPWVRWISIHAPLTGSDVQRTCNRHADISISIHAPLTGSDRSHRQPQKSGQKYFNPRSPHRERRYTIER